MNNVEHNYELVMKQDLVIQAQELVLKIPGTGLNPDDMSMLSFDHLMGVLAFLKRMSVESSM